MDCLDKLKEIIIAEDFNMLFEYLKNNKEDVAKINTVELEDIIWCLNDAIENAGLYYLRSPIGYKTIEFLKSKQFKIQ